MDVECKEHGSAYINIIPAGYSKAKNKSYEAFSVCNYDKGKPTKCKFTGPAPDEAPYDPEDDAKAYTEDLDAEKKHEADQRLINYQQQEGMKEDKKHIESRVEDKPMTRLDWNEKEFLKGLGVFSSHARSEGASPREASDTMNLWEWLDLAYGDMPGYEEWKEKAKKRIR